jgi:hypothetical protein
MQVSATWRKVSRFLREFLRFGRPSRHVLLAVFGANRRELDIYAAN